MGQRAADNAVYDQLGDRWYSARDDPIALLRAEARARNPWIAAAIERTFGDRPCRVLDVGCGGGFLANDLARRGHAVTGLDTSAEALSVAAAHDASGSARWVQGDATRPPFEEGSFEVVCAMDLLEHVADFRLVVAGASRVLVPSGLFFFHTFDRNLAAWLVVIQGVRWFVRNVPRDLHVLRQFVRPPELRAACAENALEVIEMRGLSPVVGAPLLRLVATGVVPDDLEFRFTRSLRLGYSGFARRLTRYI